MYDSGVPKKMIQERTGHRSLEALRMYERTSEQQHQAVSAVLSAPGSGKKATFNQYLEQERTNVSHTVSQSHHPAPPTFMFQDLHGCTININAAPNQHTPIASIIDHTEVQVDQLIAQINDY